jgi:hypothetical protein
MTYTNPLDELVARCDLPIMVTYYPANDPHPDCDGEQWWIIEDNEYWNDYYSAGAVRSAYIALRTRLLNEANHD